MATMPDKVAGSHEREAGGRSVVSCLRWHHLGRTPRHIGAGDPTALIAAPTVVSVKPT